MNWDLEPSRASAKLWLQSYFEATTDQSKCFARADLYAAFCNVRQQVLPSCVCVRVCACVCFVALMVCRVLMLCA